MLASDKGSLQAVQLLLDNKAPVENIDEVFYGPLSCSFLSSVPLHMSIGIIALRDALKIM
jgi:hypothetical protein